MMLNKEQLVKIKENHQQVIFENAEVEASMERETQTENIASNGVVQQCANCKRRQSNFLIQKYGENSNYFIYFHIF